MIKSVVEPPIWKPTLPPSMRTVPGADQPGPVLFRQDTYPFPYLPPTRKAAVFSEGTMTMQWAFASMSFGMPLSGVAMISGEHRGGFLQPLYRIVVFGQQGHNRQSSRQYHSHVLTFSVDPGPRRVLGDASLVVHELRQLRFLVEPIRRELRC